MRGFMGNSRLFARRKGIGREAEKPNKVFSLLLRLF
jgi:hypothetical protein